VLKNPPCPVVGTIHGVKTFSLPLEEIASKEEPVEELAVLHSGVKADWEWFAASVSRIVAVSHYAARETMDAFALGTDLVRVAYLGVDRHIFYELGSAFPHPRPYLLHVSAAPNPIKNVDRLIAAFARDALWRFCDLVIVMPGYRGRTHPKGVSFVTHRMQQHMLAKWYRGALALVFPSIRETFGLPIVEAMACGCPVITSDSTGCAEVAGNAAILVTPRCINSIAIGMSRIVTNPTLRCSLRALGLKRARQFTWEKHADFMLKVFREASMRRM
jgi:glycosyltransferase involved in cell wall biosynthesis